MPKNIKPTDEILETEVNVPKKSLFKRIVGHHNAHWWALLSTTSVLLLIVIIWAVGSWQFNQIKIGSTYLSTATLDSKFEKTLKDETNKYRITIEGFSDKPQKYKLADAGIEIDSNASLKATKKSIISWKSRMLFWRKKPATLILKTDNAKQIDFINKHAKIVNTEVKNAIIKVTPEGKVEVGQEKNGQEKSLGDAQTVINLSVQDLNPEPLVLKSRTAYPTITRNSLKPKQKQVESILLKEIKLDVEDNVITADAHDIGAWLVITPNNKKNTYDVTVDKDRVTDFINAKSSQFIRQPVNQVEIIRKDGSKIIVVKGVNGRDVTNKDAVVKTIQDELFKKDKITAELTVDYTQFRTTATDAGNKYIEVDTSAKIMYAYENDVLLRSFLISAGAPATPTVTGTYTIYSKIRIQDMRGFNVDGSTYYQPDVEFVNYFYGGYAIHGNYWRPLTWFGNVNSSHGCVGLPNSEAEWIYNWAPIGTPITIHT